jgi:hypothetical protein
MEFTICKRKVDLTKKKVEEVLERLIPETFKGRAKYYVEHKGVKYPVKQVISAVLGIPKDSFATEQACKILRALGFEVKELRRGV